MISRYFPFYALDFAVTRSVRSTQKGEVAILPESVARVITGGFTHLQIFGTTGSGKTTTLLGLTTVHAGWQARWVVPASWQHRFGTNVRGLKSCCLTKPSASAHERDRLLATVAGFCGNLRLVLSSHD